MSDLPDSFLKYLNRRGYNTFDRAEESIRHRQPWSYQNYQDSLHNVLDGEEIELFDASSALTGETVSVASGGTAATAAVSSTSALSAPVALGAGLVGAAVVGGVISSQLPSQDNHKNPIISIPGHKYAGPGNTLTDTKPIDKDDHLAQQHDKDYANSKTDQDIREADRHFIQDNVDLAKQGDIHAGINAAGIGLKYGVESITGVLYKGTFHCLILLVPWEITVDIDLIGLMQIMLILKTGLIKEVIGSI